MKRENILIASGLLQLKSTISTQVSRRWRFSTSSYECHRRRFVFILIMMHIQQETEEATQFPYRLSPAASQQLVLRAAKDYVDSANGHNDHCIALAKACLALLEGPDHSPEPSVALEARKEHNLIQALPLLDKFGVDLLPAQGISLENIISLNRFYSTSIVMIILLSLFQFACTTK